MVTPLWQGVQYPRTLQAMVQQRAQPEGPSGIARFLAQPGLSNALMSTGAALLAQSDQPGTLGGALGRALPVGMQAYQQGQEEAKLRAVIETMPPEMRRLIEALPASQRGAAMMQLLNRPGGDGFTLKPGERRFDAAGNPVAEVAPEAPEPIRVQVGDEVRFLDPVTREVLHVERLAPEEVERRDRQAGVERSRETFSQENMLADDFYTQTTVSREVADAVRRAQAAGDTAVGDQTRIIALNKLLDPGSVVREAEFERVGSAGGLSDRAQWFFNQLKDGRLPANLRNAIDAEVRAQATTARDAFAPVLGRFQYRAQQYGLEPKRIVQDWFEGIKFEANPYEGL